MQTLSTASRSQILAANGDFHRTRSKEPAVTPHIWGGGAADSFLITEFGGLKHSYRTFTLNLQIVAVLTMPHTSPHCEVAQMFSGQDRKYETRHFW